MTDNRATERLRALLDERGVEYEAESIAFSNCLTWGENDCYSYTEYQDGTVLRIWDCTPEQAIAATLGCGECEMVTSGTPCEGNTDKACTACGAYNIGEFYDEQSHRAVPNFCPNCGRRVKGGAE